MSSRKVQILNEGPVLYTDDNEDDLFLLSLVFKQSNVKNELLLFSSGHDILDYLHETAVGDKPMPALILMDINMPEMDGYEVVQKIRGQDPFIEVPSIVMLTNSCDPADMKKAVEVGADGYQVKLFGLSNYIQFINSLLPA